MSRSAPFEINRTTLKRFQAKVKVDPDTGCHLWTAGLFHGGYGKFRLGTRCVLAHRVAYELFVGPIPDGLLVLHRCDVRACVNVEHLFLGTQRDNIHDMHSKGRGAAGERNANAKLTADDVRAIRARAAAGESPLVIGREYGLARTSAYDVINRTWRWLK